MVSFENEEFIFPAVHHSFKFCILTIAGEARSEKPRFSFFLRKIEQMQEAKRQFSLSLQEISRINPNTKTAPIFRSRYDAELTTKIYTNVPVLVDDAANEDQSLWGIGFQQGLFNMTSDSGVFRTSAQLQEMGYERQDTSWHLAKITTESPDSSSPVDAEREGDLERLPQIYVPLYEAKMIHFFDHRFGSYAARGNDRGFRVLPETSLQEHIDADFEPASFYFVPSELVERNLNPAWQFRWLIAFKDVTSAISERTAIFSFIPRVGVGHSAPLIFSPEHPRRIAALVASLTSLVVDFCVRSKVGGLHLTFFYLKQLPVLPPTSYGPSALEFIVPRVLELTYTSNSMEAFARDLGYDGPPFIWDEDRRATLRSELDAWFAHAYGLTRDELRYILDPADVMGPDYPSETFRVLKNNEIGEYGEYRTGRLVLEAWDRMEAGELPAPTPYDRNHALRVPAPNRPAASPDTALQPTLAFPDAGRE